MKGQQPYFFIICLFIIIQLTIIINGHREHKVHNIVLYPDKNSWCKTLPIKQIISYPGCKSEEIDNNVCVGACFSYSIPHTEPSDPGEVIVPYCDSCQPSETTWQHITLECEKDNNNNDNNTPPLLIKRVQIIKNCSCSPCEKNGQLRNGDIDDDDSDIHGHEHNDVPDLIDVLNIRNETNIIIPNEETENVKLMLNHKLVLLLQNIQENNSEYDKVQLMELLKMIQGPEHKISDKHIEDFVESLNDENIELDIPKLKEVLIKYEHSKFLEKYISNNNHNIINNNSNSNNNNSNNNKQLIDNNDNNDGIEGSHHNLGHLKGSHIGMGLHDINNNKHNDDDYENDDDNINDDNNNDDIINKTTDEHIKKHINNNNNNNHHHVGDIIGNGHLTRGPHGSLVIQPDNININNNNNYNTNHNINNNHNNKNIHEKLDVNPHELKPNHAGTLLSYSSHSDKTKPIDD